MSDMTFIRGTYIQLEATTTIHLGRLERNITKGDIIEYDGTNIKFNGQETSMPELKSGIKRGWLKVVVPTQPVLIDQALEAKAKVAVATPAVAPQAVAQKPKLEVQKVYDEEREVPSKLKKEEAPQAKKFPIQIDKREDDLRPVSKVDSKSGASVAGHDETGVIMTEAGINLKTASKGKKLVLNDASAIDAEMNKLENMSFQKNKFAIKRDEDSIVKTTTTIVEEAPIEVVEQPLVEEEGEIEIEMDAPEAPLNIEVQDQVKEDLDTLNALESQSSTGAVEVGAEQADTFVWDKTLHWQGRAKLAVEKFANDPESLEKVKSVESKGVVDLINKLMSEKTE